MSTTDPEFLLVRDRIMRPGSVSVFTSDEQVYNALVSVQMARESGHAVSYDEMFEEGYFVSAHVTHYLICVKCKEERKNVH